MLNMITIETISACINYYFQRTYNAVNSSDKLRISDPSSDVITFM